ncbi:MULTISPECIES: NUDIX domain-containing protein [unclassified Clostridium]|uniref:NUDIX domain-containing protein n=1 Tax=unclassified Clostridium TaxID=2614128 RepID=UPI0020799A77|nr:MULTISPECIES: NUDIX domain-containing protein [unclassified Clostridium]
MNKEKLYIDEKIFLKNYDVNEFERPSVTNDVIIFTTDDVLEENSRKVPRKGMEVLLVKRDDHPSKGKWAIPGGFVKMDESLEEGAIRRLREETGIDNVYIEQLYTFGELERDPRTRVISVGNIALIAKENINFNKTKDTMETKWFWIKKDLIESIRDEKYLINKYILELKSEDCEETKISYEITEKIEKGILRRKVLTYNLMNNSNEELAFDHYKILDYALDRVRNKIEYTPIALNLLPRLFTVKELQFVYEAIMGREILNFRRKMDDMIIETDEKIEGKPFRPAKVFKFNENFEHKF